MGVNISYCISVCNEAEELNKLLGQIIPNIDSEDELIILVDTSKITSEVSQVISNHRSLRPDIQLVGAELNGDFATFKNNFVTSATKDMIWQLDADELLNDEMFISLKSIIDFNPQVDMFLVPRINIVKGIGLTYIQKWRWQVSKNENFINEKVLDLDDPKDLDEYNLLKQNNLIIEEIMEK